MPLQQTTGNVTTDAYGGGVAAVPNYIEDVFSTYLYTGTGGSQTITNGIDLSTKGGLTWIKQRNGTYNNILTDTARGVSKFLYSDQTNAQESYPGYGVTAFNTTGFAVTDTTVYGVNASGSTYASWTFRKQPKFFDVVTYTGTGSAQTIAHNLGSAPGCIIVKGTDSTYNWPVYHQSLGAGYLTYLNLINASTTSSNAWANTSPTSTSFYVSTSPINNEAGKTYVAYLFAHNAGGFGLTGTDNVISCGSFTTDGSGNATVSLGYEPQWVMVKSSSAAGDWNLIDTMRGWSNAGSYGLVNWLQANQTYSESNSAWMTPNATGFSTPDTLSASTTYIYIAIRKGPMKVPTSGTSVFAPVAYAGTGSAATTTTGFVTDLAIIKSRGTYSPSFEDRLRGANIVLESSSTGAEITTTQYVLGFDTQSGVRIGNDAGVNASGTNYIDWAFRRAPSFFDEVCYTGTGVARTVTHNLGVAPEMYIIKNRGTGTNWAIYSAYLSPANDKNLYFTTAGESTNTNIWSTPTSTTFGIGTGLQSAPAINANGSNYVAYLFATCAGVSKVGSYTGNGSTQTINCGFTGGARFVLIKRTDSTGDWYVYDTARGMTTLTDPYLLMNSTAAETATLGSVTSVSTGFAVNASILAAINTNAASYIFLAIA